jgi:hypothetical protein
MIHLVAIRINTQRKINHKSWKRLSSKPDRKNSSRKSGRCLRSLKRPVNKLDLVGDYLLHQRTWRRLWRLLGINSLTWNPSTMKWDTTKQAGLSSVRSHALVMRIPQLSMTLSYLSSEATDILCHFATYTPLTWLRACRAKPFMRMSDLHIPMLLSIAISYHQLFSSSSTSSRVLWSAIILFEYSMG